MPIYPFRCDSCGAEFEISRKISAMRDPAPCPACGTEARRIFTPIAVTGQAVDPAVAAKQSADARAAKQAAAWSHFGHSHGPGSGAHSHGGQATPPPGTAPTPAGQKPSGSTLDNLAQSVTKDNLPPPPKPASRK